jgi:hypothetical protein
MTTGRSTRLRNTKLSSILAIFYKDIYFGAHVPHASSLSDQPTSMGHSLTHSIVGWFVLMLFLSL